MLTDNPFHAGEREAQGYAGASDIADKVKGFVRNYLPDQHREFHTALPFLVVSAADKKGQPWITIVEGEDGFITSPTDTSLAIKTVLSDDDPLSSIMNQGADIGLLGIDFATRRRNRLSGFARWSDGQYSVTVRQSFGNCPQYIHPRNWYRSPTTHAPIAQHSKQLNTEQITRIQYADTLFIGTGQQNQADLASNGYDASHRGGASGFVQVVDATRLQIPDYAGNNFFNSIGNILLNPKIGLLIVDFPTGDLLHITGHARINWQPDTSIDANAQRFIEVDIVSIIDRPSALSLRWFSNDSQLSNFRVARKEEESAQITSFFLESADGQSIPKFTPGQHLPIQLTIPGAAKPVQRSYSLSGAPHLPHLRISVKREDQGVASQFLHDQVAIGHYIKTMKPAGTFQIPDGSGTLLLISAGVGLTPMVSMLHFLANSPVNRPVWFIHGARNGRFHAMRDEVNSLINKNTHVKRRYYYSQPEDADRLGVDYDVAGRISVDSILELSRALDTRYLLCGPAKFVSSILQGLETAGVPPSYIHEETF